MEYREITQLRIFVLVLNTFGRAEDSCIAAISDNYQRLSDYYNSQLLPQEERFRDEAGFVHSFSEGELFRLNPCWSIELNNVDHYGNGIHDEWIDSSNWEHVKQNYFTV